MFKKSSILCSPELQLSLNQLNIVNLKLVSNKRSRKMCKINYCTIKH